MKNSNWFTEELFGFKKIFLFLIIVTGFKFITNIGTIFIMQILKIEISPNMPNVVLMKNSNFPLFLLLSAIVEEIIFRLLPLSLSVLFWGKSYKVFVIMILSAIVFGWLHNGFEHIFIQGFSAVILGILFLKTGGFQMKFLKATFCCVIVHFSFNMICFCIWSSFQ